MSRVSCKRDVCQGQFKSYAIEFYKVLNGMWDALGTYRTRFFFTGVSILLCCSIVNIDMYVFVIDRGGI